MVRQFQMHGAEFFQAIDDTVFACATEPRKIGTEMSSSLEHVRLEFRAGTLRTVATDGHRIAMRQVDCDYGEYDEFSTLLYRKEAKKIAKAFKREKEVLGILDGDLLTIKTIGKSDHVYHNPHMEYAKWQQVIPNETRLVRGLRTQELKDSLRAMFSGIPASMISNNRRGIKMTFEGGDDNTVLWLEPGSSLQNIAHNVMKDKKIKDHQPLEDLARGVPRLVQPIPRIEETVHVWIDPTFLLGAVESIPDADFTFAHHYDNDDVKDGVYIESVRHAIVITERPFKEPLDERPFMHMIMPLRPQ